MTEDEDKKEEEKFDFTPEDEALDFVTLDQARFVAMQTAREQPGNRNYPVLDNRTGLL